MSSNFISVVEGEASESEDEIINEVNSTNIDSISKCVVVSGEASESDDEICIDTEPKIEIVEEAVEIISEVDVSSLQKTEKIPKYDTLLHKKLYETNKSLRSNLKISVQNPYDQCVNSLNEITSGLVKTQISIQETANLFRSLNKDMICLKEKLNTALNCHFIPNINMQNHHQSSTSSATSAIES